MATPLYLGMTEMESVFCLRKRFSMAQSIDASEASESR